MSDEGNEEAAETAVNRYGEAISEAASVLDQAAQSGEGFDEALSALIAQATSIHLMSYPEFTRKCQPKLKK